jgi:heparanase
MLLISEDRVAAGTTSMLEFRHAGKWIPTCAISIPLVTSALADGLSITPASMPLVGKIDERFQSYNVEIVEVTGGGFWKPYGRKPLGPPPKHAEMDSDLFAYRPPIDLANNRLRRLAAALAPAYLRISGTWANSTYFSDSDTTQTPPAGFDGI